jgi:hypothetical protein
MNRHAETTGKQSIRKTAAIVLSIMLGSGAYAGAPIPMAGKTDAKSSSVTYQTDAGQVLVALSATHEGLVMESADHPMADMAGECTGHMILTPPSAAGAGICAYTDGAGDKAFVRFNVDAMTADGGVTGSWTGLGGTGRFAGMSGEGQYSNTPIAADGTYQTSIKGSMMLP